MLLLIGATTVFGELQDALDRIWRAPAREQRGRLWSLLRARLLSFGMILGIGFLLMVSLVVSAALSALGKWWGALLRRLGRGCRRRVNFVVGFALTTAVFAMIYKLMPRVQVRWHDVWIGAVVTALLFTIGKFLIGLYIGKSGVASGFGAAGSLVVLLRLGLLLGADLPARRRVHLGLCAHASARCARSARARRKRAIPTCRRAARTRPRPRRRRCRCPGAPVRRRRGRAGATSASAWRWRWRCATSCRGSCAGSSGPAPPAARPAPAAYFSIRATKLPAA